MEKWIKLEGNIWIVKLRILFRIEINSLYIYNSYIYIYIYIYMKVAEKTIQIGEYIMM